MYRNLEDRRAAIHAQWGDWEPGTLSTHFDACAGRWPDVPFLIAEDQQATYQQLVDLSWRIAAAAARAGIRPGDRIAIVMGNVPDFLAAKIAAARLGAVSVSINYLLGADELKAVLDSAQPHLMIANAQIGTREILPLLEAVGLPTGDMDGPLLVVDGCAELPKGATPLETWLDGAEVFDRSQLAGVDPSDEPVAEILYTSGSTGVAKGVMLKHHALLREGYTTALVRGLDQGWRTMTSLPTFHLFGWAQAILPTSFVGGTLVCGDKFDPEVELSWVSRHSVDDIVCVPAMLQRLVDVAEQSRPRLDSLRAIFAAGDPVPEALWARARAALGVEEITNGFGMSEVSGAPFLLPIDASDEQRAVCVGRFKYRGERGLPDRDVYQREFRIVDPDTLASVAVGEAGELQYRGSAIFAGYWRNEVETSRAYSHDGWFRSGDLGKLRADGLLELAGRIKDLYRTGGELVSPAEVEAVIAAMEGVSSVYVVGVPDERWGEMGWAFVVPRPDASLTPEDVIQYCRERMAKYKVPRQVRLLSIDQVPKTASGKVHKAGLVQLAKELDAGHVG